MKNHRKESFKTGSFRKGSLFSTNSIKIKHSSDSDSFIYEEDHIFSKNLKSSEEFNVDKSNIEKLTYEAPEAQNSTFLQIIKNKSSNNIKRKKLKAGIFDREDSDNLEKSKKGRKKFSVNNLDFSEKKQKPFSNIKNDEKWYSPEKQYEPKNSEFYNPGFKYSAEAETLIRKSPSDSFSRPRSVDKPSSLKKNPKQKI